MFPCEDSKTVSVRTPRKEITIASSISCSPTLVIDTSMERSLRVLQHGNPIFLNLELNFDLYFDLCQRAEIFQVGLSMNLYVDIGDASSSLRGSTFSLMCKTL